MVTDKKLYKTALHLCLNCDNAITNPLFCSRSCSAIYNNKKFPKRVAKKCFCKSCNVEISAGRTTCDNCNPSFVDWTKVLLGEVIYKANNSESSNRYTRIRDNSKNVYKNSNKPKQCCNCGYTKHFEVCHIVPISAHSLDTPVSVINSLDNLVALCPNCHWEFDNGLLIL